MLSVHGSVDCAYIRADFVHRVRIRDAALNLRPTFADLRERCTGQIPPRQVQGGALGAALVDVPADGAAGRVADVDAPRLLNGAESAPGAHRAGRPFGGGRGVRRLVHVDAPCSCRPCPRAVSAVAGVLQFHGTALYRYMEHHAATCGGVLQHGFLRSTHG